MQDVMGGGVGPVLPAPAEPGALHPQARQHHRLVGPDGPDLRVLRLARGVRGVWILEGGCLAYTLHPLSTKFLY